MDYKQVFENCGSDKVAKLEWVNVNTGEPITGGIRVFQLNGALAVRNRQRPLRKQRGVVIQKSVKFWSFFALIKIFS